MQVEWSSTKSMPVDELVWLFNDATDELRIGMLSSVEDEIGEIVGYKWEISNGAITMIHHLSKVPYLWSELDDYKLDELPFTHWAYLPKFTKP
jgi:hypothetical protein